MRRRSSSCGLAAVRPTSAGRSTIEFTGDLRETLKNSSMIFFRDEKRSAIFVFLHYSIAYAIEYWRHIPVPWEPLNKSEVP